MINFEGAAKQSSSRILCMCVGGTVMSQQPMKSVSQAAVKLKGWRQARTDEASFG